MAGAITIPNQPSWAKSIYHIYAILTPERDKMIEQFNAAGIGTGIHYPIPVHLQTPYKALGYKPGDFPVSEKIAAETLSLPMFPGPHRRAAAAGGRLRLAIPGAAVERSRCKEIIQRSCERRDTACRVPTITPRHR